MSTFIPSPAAATGTDPPAPTLPPSTGYPVQLTAWRDEPLSRWLWLVKWFLLIPHCLVLLLLYVGYLAVTVVAFIAILVTGHYPRWAFGYTVGVLRWSWRVQYYGYGALATDRYPPFTLTDVPDYPARLDISYPEHPSRGKALVQWWLLPIPHFIVLAILLGAQASTSDGSWEQGSNVPGLIGLLTLVAGLALLFTATYPAGLWRLLVGLNRWVYRVVAYASLLTDRYPPFRMDQGGSEDAELDPHLSVGPDAGRRAADSREV
jgi:hypothetical protein